MSPKKMAASVMTEEGRTSPKKKRESFMDRVWSPSKRNFFKGPYSRKAEQRVVKRRAQKAIKSSKSHDPDADSDSESRTKKEQQPEARKGFVQGTLAPWLKVVEDHPNAPSILITYLQLFTNMALIFFSMYVVYSLWCGILSDVDKGIHESQAETFLEIAACNKDFEQMNCRNPVRAAIEICHELQKCIDKDPKKIARAQVSARAFAKIINDFAEPISLKAMAFYLSIFAIFWYSTNATWNGLRNKLSPEHFQPHQYHPMPPPTPQRLPSNGMYPPNTPFSVGYYTPGHYLQSAMEAGPSAVPADSQRKIEFG
jgi:Di-sulfide bridge nucleocytoplasmic transport domain